MRIESVVPRRRWHGTRLLFGLIPVVHESLVPTPVVATLPDGPVLTEQLER